MPLDNDKQLQRKVEILLNSIQEKDKEIESLSRAVRSLQEQLNNESEKEKIAANLLLEELASESCSEVELRFLDEKSDDISEKILKVKSEIKKISSSEEVLNFIGDLFVNDSSSKGRKRQRLNGKFLITAFNALASDIIISSRKNKFQKCRDKINKWFFVINEMAADDYVEISDELRKINLELLELTVCRDIKKSIEQEEERYVQECIREEAKLQKDIDKFVNGIEAEEKTYRNKLKKANEDMKIASGERINSLLQDIYDLTAKIKSLEQEKQRAISLAQLTRSGHVYIISNEGSFGGNVYKIGMTRRLDPMDRIRELGDASVPFYFDVYKIISTDDAPTLEKKLHSKLERFRVNKDNYRREFFKVDLDMIEKTLNEALGDEYGER